MKCPNCGQNISEQDERCPYCNFDVKNFREKYFAKESNKRNNAESSINEKTPVFSPKNQNTTIAAMIKWIQLNAIIVFLTGVGLLILMSFSRSLGWICFFALLIWLFIVCQKHPNTQQYTADQRLAEKVNQVGSDVANSMADHHQKLKAKRIEQGKKPIAEEIDQTIKEKRSTLQIGVVLLAIVNLLVLFFGPFSSSTVSSYQSSSITKILLSVGGLGGKYTLFGYGLWLLFFIIPIAIIVLTIKNKKNNRRIVFLLSLLETIFIVLVAFELIFMNAGSLVGFSNNVQDSQHVKKMVSNLISFGISSYLLLISNVLTTWLAWRSLKNKQL
ncbi:MAG: zinc ribbon domain-containing protein [Lactobacillus sp.]|nr:zinc ribbon domain-containing protein [Lactobacillus sp.]